MYKMVRKTMFILLAILVLLNAKNIEGASQCQHPAIFSFGDTSFDTGTLHFLNPFNEIADKEPYGKTFFGHPVGRFSDGRIFIDFLAQEMGYPFLNPYLQSLDSNFSHGVNFAAAGATIRENGILPTVPLPVQMEQFKLFRQKVMETIILKGPSSTLPTEEAFAKGLYIIGMGATDLIDGYIKLNLNTTEMERFIVRRVAASVTKAVQLLYKEGARTILVMDMMPQGCQPFFLSYFKVSKKDTDKAGCSKPHNEVVLVYNRILRAQLNGIRRKASDANIVYLNSHDIVYNFIANPSKYGFKYTTTACCGVGGKYNYTHSLRCGESKVSEGSGNAMKADSCGDPENYVNWDGLHLTDQANRILIRHIFSSNLFRPYNFSFPSHCEL